MGSNLGGANVLHPWTKCLSSIVPLNPRANGDLVGNDTDNGTGFKISRLLVQTSAGSMYCTLGQGTLTPVNPPNPSPNGELFGMAAAAAHHVHQDDCDGFIIILKNSRVIMGWQ